MQSRHRLFAALMCAALGNSVHADRSRLDDESDVVEAGDCELEIAFSRKKLQHAKPGLERSLQLGCGIGLKTEVAAAIVQSRGDEGRADGYALEAKTAWRERSRAGFGGSLFYGLERMRMSETSWRTQKLFLGTELVWELSSAWLLEARLGTARDRPARQNSTAWMVGIEHTLTGAINGHAALEGDDRGRPEWRFGLRYKLWPEHALISLEYGLGTGSERHRSVGAAITFEF
jgi:hypothetical protein